VGVAQEKARTAAKYDGEQKTRGKDKTKAKSGGK
jgi:hypothetical protein